MVFRLVFLCLFWRFKAHESDSLKSREREQGMQLGDPQITLPSRTFRQKTHICCIHSHTKIMALKRIVSGDKLGQI